MILSNKRKSELAQLAEAYSNEYIEDGIVDLIGIAKFEEIHLIHDNYDGQFEGLTVCEDNNFFIHMDSTNNPTLETGRSRFTFAHELAHTLIDNHRIGLLTGTIKPHISKYIISDKTAEIEKEADYFASCLLMPELKFKAISKSFCVPFSLDSISQISNHFRTSFLATLMRFIEVGTESLFVTFNKEDKVKWFHRSSDFPSWPFKFKAGGIPPQNTVIGDYIRDKSKKYEEVEEVDSEDWFYVKDDNFDDLKLYEQCKYVEQFGYVISVLWFAK